jgi:hypothetical protein
MYRANPIHMRHFIVLSSALLGLAAAPLFAQTDDLPAICGKVVNENYTVSSGAFTIRIPVLPELGGQIHDSLDSVTFADDCSTHATIAALPLDAPQRKERDSRGLRDYLTYFLSGLVIPDLQEHFPGTHAESAVFIPGIQCGALLAYLLVPRGSAFADKADIGLDEPTPIVAKLGELLFYRNGCVFMITLELSERVTEGTLFTATTEEENALLRARLLVVLDSITFAAPPDAPVAK